MNETEGRKGEEIQASTGSGAVAWLKIQVRHGPLRLAPSTISFGVHGGAQDCMLPYLLAQFASRTVALD